MYLAQDLTLERSVALKVLPPRLVRNEERLRRFVIEAKAASSLNHPSIVTIYEIGSGAIERDGEATEPIHFIAMERIDGHMLSELIHVDRGSRRLPVTWPRRRTGSQGALGGDRHRASSEHIMV